MTGPAADGAYSLTGLAGRELAGVPIESGTFEVAGNQLQLHADSGCLDARGGAFPCTGVYQVSIGRKGQKPVQLKLTAVADQSSDRRRSLHNQTLALIQP